MALTIEQYNLMNQVMQNITGLRRDARMNAEGYKAALTAVRPADKVAEVMKADASEYLRRLDWIKDLVADAGGKAKVEGALSALGINKAELYAQYNELRASAQATFDAAILTEADINGRADAVLSEVAPQTILW